MLEIIAALYSRNFFLIAVTLVVLQQLPLEINIGHSFEDLGT
jgi:hypothetical protein